MPGRPARPCGYPGCGKLVRDGSSRCEKHPPRVDKRHVDQRRGTTSERGYGWAWQKARAAFLSSHPLCAEHERQGRVVAASVVDHRIPHRGDQRLFWDRSNWQPLCKSCHDTKTASEDGGFGNPGGYGKSAKPQSS
jgi:5-methylcytosine-specific restriction protein A